MDIYSKLYWLSRLDNLSNLFTACLIIGTITCVIMLIYRGFLLMEDDDYIPNYWRRSICITIFLIGLLGTVFLPTQKQIIFIVAAGKTIDFAQKDTSIQKVPGQTTQLLSNWLEKETNNLKKEIKEDSSGSEKKEPQTLNKKVDDQSISDMVKEEVRNQIKQEIKEQIK